MGRLPLSDTAVFLSALGVDETPARTSPFDPGYDPVTLESHLEQSAHLIDCLKLSMASWLVANASATARKLDAARSSGVRTVAGGGPFEIATDRGLLDRYLDLCAGLGFGMIECAEGFTKLKITPHQAVESAVQRGLQVQYEMGGKHTGPFTAETLAGEIDKGRDWLEAGAVQLVVEAREDARGSGVFDEQGDVRLDLIDGLIEAFGLDALVFEAPTKLSQFALLDHVGPTVRLGNVRLEELLRVEVYRRGLHSDSYRSP